MSVAEHDSAVTVEETGEPGSDTETGKLFEVPRVGVLVDETDPTVIKLAFSGAIELNRVDQADVQFFNGLKAGKPAELRITAHVAGAKTTHDRDSEGDVDAVVQTKTLVVHSADIE